MSWTDWSYWNEHRSRLALVVIVAVILFYGIYNGVSGEKVQEKGEIAEIGVEGIISYNGKSSEILPKARMTPDDLKKLVDEAKKDSVDAYLFRINSPGGQVVASKDMARIIESLEKPAACLMQEVAASGAYWLATECDRIFADSLTVTGSIGVSSTYLQYSGLLEEYGIKYVNLTAGRYKDMRSPYKNLTAEERDILTEQLDTVHEAFIRQVANERGMSEENVREHATGQAFMGGEAERIGLIDSIGRKKDAKEYLENRTGRKLSVKSYREQDTLDILSLLPVKIGYGIGKAFTAAQENIGGIEALYRKR
ncbi:MAG: signal peptide peptidase SppA [Candidatus Nanohaloarchaea archaeon]|nr:signal peptide peptidase SppA [Candidatus Nanohaloarchaea archaeon]